MSWKGFQKAVDRASTSILQKTGAIEKTIDKEYEEEEKRYKLLESKIEKLNKEAKGYLDAVRALSISQSRIAENLNQFYNENDPYAQFALKYKKNCDLLDEEIRTRFDLEYRECVLEPLGGYCELFPVVGEVVKRRGKKMLDYDMLRSKVRKLAEKPSDDVDKLPKTQKQMSEAKDLYQHLNSQLIEDLPKLGNLRLEFIDPTFESLIHCQIQFVQDALNSFEELKNGLTGGGSGSIGGSEYRVEETLQQMRELSIVKAVGGK